MVFFIKSAIHKGYFREFIRRTWKQLSYVDGFQLSTVFLVGRADTKKLQSLLDEEYDRYQDILQLNISDQYSFIARKTLGGMKWASENLNESYYYSSGDDDVIVDLGALVKAIKRHKELASNGSWPHFPILCSLRAKLGDLPFRNVKSKYYTSLEDYKWPFFPDFCLGGAYTTSVAVAGLLWEASRGVKPMKMDDVWITGVLRSKIGMPRQFIRQLAPPIAEHYYGFVKAIGKNRREFMQDEWGRVMKKYENLSMCWCS